MRHPSPKRALYLGMRDGNLDGKPYAKFWRRDLAPLVEHAREALACGPVAAPLLPELADASSLLTSGYQELENGFGARPDGSIGVAIRTDMPDASPAMIDWWFGWHGSEMQRYKLWHPRAHLHAEWAVSAGSGDRDAAFGRARYVGRTSFVDEYLGSALQQAAIQFVSPRELGFDEAALRDADQATVVCARIGLAGTPLDAGTLIHHVRRVPGGSEMRSRFWLGGSQGRVRGAGEAGRVAARLVGRFVRPTLDLARDLLVHCSQEMSHLASFLPALHAELRDTR